MFETLYRACDGSWVRDKKLAERLPWDDAERLSLELRVPGGHTHAVVCEGTLAALPDMLHAKVPAPGAEDVRPRRRALSAVERDARLSRYQRLLERMKLD